MKKFIRELRRREVFRTAGLYIGLSWLLIEVASVVMPAFDAPDWVLRALIIVVIAGFPVMLVLAWIYDITENRIVVQADATDTVVPPLGSRKMDFVVIGILSLALMVSVYLNITGGPVATEQPDPISVLIADFDNTTGDTLFQGTLEEALQIGIEGASFITAYERPAALALAGKINSATVLDEATARLVSVREDVKLVLAGRIEEDGGRYEFIVRAVEPQAGDEVARAKATARSKLDVLASMGELAADLREELGDKSLDRDRMAARETFTAASLEAAKAYTTAQDLQAVGNDQEAATHYATAVELDPSFGRAYSGWALSAFNLGQTDKAEELWQQALTHLETMTERERLRTLGLYYSVVSRNYPKAIESYKDLVDQYPADDSAHNNLAVLYFFTLDFAAALEEGARVLAVYPNVSIYRGNYALYAMYAGDFETAVSAARDLLESDPSYFKAWLPIAMQALASDDIATAKDAYDKMIATGEQGTATGMLGLADTAIFSGEFAAARDALSADIQRDIDDGNQYMAAAKYMAIADSYRAEGNAAEAVTATRQALQVSPGEPWVILAALNYIDAGEVDEATAIANDLDNELQRQSRAYGKMIHGLILSLQGQYVAAIETMTEGLALADLWLLRFHLGQVYLAAGHNAAALDEFTHCGNRRGEATALFLDDLPTFRYTVPLMYWLGVAQNELGMSAAASDNFSRFLALRPNGGALAADARERTP